MSWFERKWLWMIELWDLSKSIREVLDQKKKQNKKKLGCTFALQRNIGLFFICTSKSHMVIARSANYVNGRGSHLSTDLIKQNGVLNLIVFFVNLLFAEHKQD